MEKGGVVVQARPAGRGHRGLQRVAAFEHRQAIQARPDAGARAASPATRRRRGSRASSSHSECALRLSLRVFTGYFSGVPSRRAAHRSLHRAEQATRVARQADGGAQVHQALRVARHRFLQRRAAAAALRPVPTELRSLLPRTARSASKPSTRVSTRLTLPSRMATRSPKQNDGDRRGGGSADAGQRLQHLRRCAETRRRAAPRPPARSGAGCARGCSSPGRSTARAPRPVGAAASAVTSGKRARKRGVVIQHRGHLRLLQHDLGEPDAVGVARVLPGQAVAPVAAAASAPRGRQSPPATTLMPRAAGGSAARVAG